MSDFEKASRLGLRFSTSKGLVTTEDLWNLPLTTASATGASLDNAARGLSKQLKEAETESFVVKTTKADDALQLQFEIVKHIIAVRLAENEAALAAKQAKEKKQRILALIEQKQDEKLLGSSLEELQSLAATL